MEITVGTDRGHASITTDGEPVTPECAEDLLRRCARGIAYYESLTPQPAEPDRDAGD